MRRPTRYWRPSDWFSSQLPQCTFRSAQSFPRTESRQRDFMPTANRGEAQPDVSIKQAQAAMAAIQSRLATAFRATTVAGPSRVRVTIRGGAAVRCGAARAGFARRGGPAVLLLGLPTSRHDTRAGSAAIAGARDPCRAGRRTRTVARLL